MTDERPEGSNITPDVVPIRVEAREILVDYEQQFADLLTALEQMIYEFRHRRGAGAEGQEQDGAFASFNRNGTVAFTARSTHAGHMLIESHGRRVLIDFSNPEETLKISADGQHSSIDADAAGTYILTDVQSRLVEIDLDSLSI